MVMTVIPHASDGTHADKCRIGLSAPLGPSQSLSPYALFPTPTHAPQVTTIVEKTGRPVVTLDAVSGRPASFTFGQCKINP